MLWSSGLFKAADMKAAGYACEQLLGLGCSERQLLEAGHTDPCLSNIGQSTKKHSNMCAGFHQHLIAISYGGLRAQDVKEAGVTAAQMRALGCSATALRAAGFSAEGMMIAGYNAKELLAAGCRYSCRDSFAFIFDCTCLPSAA